MSTTHSAGPQGTTDRPEDTATSSADTATVPQGTDIPPRRWCRFASIWCRCGAEQLETVHMHVCAQHYLHEVVSADA